ncbi:hypothetical protein LIER_27599 [Lithospermum erythrorhizon]|uniref:Reverse transcriptase zinc-binding domain-containing protein n=1 Tax=Lithospermum erythrorhizon TaxID=34254 RepID=A0AAV3RGJ5_LITER
MRFNDKESVADVWGRQITFTIRGITSNILKVKEAMAAVDCSREDALRWDNYEQISYSRVLSSMRQSADKVRWHKISWSKSNVPKHYFIAWLACLRKLPTKDKMMSWNVIDNMKCVLCDGDEEAGHLFFECNFARGICSRMLFRLHWNRRPGTWEEELDFKTEKCDGRSFKARLSRVVFCAANYHKRQSV